jgi:hypothetical protein
MSAWANLYNLASSWIKRPAVWLGGFLAAAAGTYVTTNLMPSVQTFLSEKMAEKACQYRQKPVASDSQFTILVSPLARDPDRSHTEKIMRALLGEEGFLTVPICDSLDLDLSKGSQAWEDMQQRATEVINAKHADLLLFGFVSVPGQAVVIYAVNEHGGCDRQPKPTEIKLNVLGSEFTAPSER